MDFGFLILSAIVRTLYVGLVGFPETSAVRDIFLPIGGSFNSLSSPKLFFTTEFVLPWF